MSDGPAPATQRKPRMREQPQPVPTLDPQHATNELKRFLDLVVREMGLATSYEVSALPDAKGSPRQANPSEREADIVVRFSGDDEDILLSRNGELLLALEYLAHRWLRLEPALHDRVRFDCGDYRATRLEELKLSARVAAQRVRETGQPFRFNPMSSRDRRTIHLELTGAPGVRTISEGSGDHRHLVIFPVTSSGRK